MPLPQLPRLSTTLSVGGGGIGLSGRASFLSHPLIQGETLPPGSAAEAH